ncbi:hypothetical protein N7528_010193 [Penicillium herquei]|nr:hypothetical protein N7528_010193 [Penicillium herquei]
MAPKLEPCFTLRGYIGNEHTIMLNGIKSGPTRGVTPITHGYIEGSGLKAEILPGGADYVLIDPETQNCHIDVRTTARTPEGHGLYIHYKGLLKMDEKATKILSGAPDAQSTEYGDHEWFTTPVMETDDPNFKWIESSVFVAQGHLIVDDPQSALEYQIYKLVN